MDNIWTCINGHPGNDANFCSVCGTKDRLVTWTCINGHAGNVGKFCSQCGAINSPAQTVAAGYNPPAPQVSQPVYQFDPSSPKPEGWQPPVMIPAPAAPTPEEPKMSPEDNKRANMFSLLSLGLFLLGPMMYAVCEGIWGDIDNWSGGLKNCISSLSGLFLLGSLVALVYVRVKYPKNVFGKVLMYLAIILVIGTIAMFILMVIACSILCEGCRGM